MAYTLYTNPNSVIGDTSIDFGDLNEIYSGSGVSGDLCIYWNNIRSTPINMRVVYENLVANGYHVPTYGMTNELVTLAYDGQHEDIADVFRNEYNWIVGSFDEKVGLIAYIDGENHVTVAQYWWNEQTVIGYGIGGTTTVVSPSLGTVDNIGYFVDIYYNRGVASNFSGIMNGYYTVIDSYNPIIAPPESATYPADANGVMIHGGDSCWSSPTTRYVPYMRGAFQVLDNGWGAQAISAGYEKKPDAYGKTGGDTKPDGGNGEVRVSVEIDHPTTPPEMLSESGLVKFYTPTATELNNFAHYLYTQADNWYTNLKKMWINPFESIITFGVVPFAITRKTSEVVKFCGLSTNVSMATCDQYVTKNFGDLTIPMEHNSALDFSNYTKIKAFLPFIGFVDLNTDDVMNAKLNLQYVIDLLTGDCVATIKCTKKWSDYEIDYDSVLYHYKGNVLAQAPISGNNYSGLYSSLLNVGTNILMPTPQSVAGIASEVMGQKVSVQHGSSVGANSGHLGIYRPYVIVEDAIPSTTNEMYKYQAYPMNEAVKLEFYKKKGYTKLKSGTLRINNFKGTKEEEEEIIRLCETGVIL